jgi:hypothetical protein
VGNYRWLSRVTVLVSLTANLSHLATAILFSGSNLTARTPQGIAYEALVLSDGGKPKSFAHSITFQLDSRHPLPMKGKMVSPTTLEIRLAKDIDPSSFTSIVADALEGNTSGIPVTNAWWEGTFLFF